MAKEIWNEGRVVGYSAYEVYVKQHMSEDPTTPPATEREWLASSLAMGSSMIFRVPDISQAADANKWIGRYLPRNSKLAAANTIVAQFFDGEAEFDEDGWAIKVTDYSPLLSNTADLSPSGYTGPTSGGVSAKPDSEFTWSETKLAQLKEYMRICDGLIIQPGTWVDNPNKPPEKDFQADLSKYPRIRLHIRGPISHGPLILLTGFTIRSVLSGTVGQDTAVNTDSPQDGDFLGPAVFPWAAKIVFCVPNSYISQIASGTYKRSIETPTSGGTKTTKTIKDTAVIDMQASKPETFYNGYQSSEYYKRFSADSTDPRYPYTVDGFNTLGEAPTDGEAVLTVYQRKNIYPPALYGTFVAETGEHYLNPLDVVAPGTIKMFNDQSSAVLQAYQETFPGTTAMNKSSSGTVQILNSENKLIDAANIMTAYLNTTEDGVESDGFETPRTMLTGSNRPKVAKIRAGHRSVYALMMSSKVGTSYEEAYDSSTTLPSIEISKIPTKTKITLTANNSNDNISWSALLDALATDRAIDLLGDRLKSVKASLVRSHGSGQGQGPYLEFGQESKKLRLYITDTMPDPTDVPVGSIGIGWGFTPD